jgi:hypothetical protein
LRQPNETCSWSRRSPAAFFSLEHAFAADHFMGLRFASRREQERRRAQMTDAQYPVGSQPFGYAARARHALPRALQ